MIFPTIYKRTTKGKVQQWTIELNKNKFRTISGQVDGKKVTSEYTICYSKNIGKANETSDNEQALLEVQALIKKKLESGYSESIDMIDSISENINAVMLAKNYEDNKDKIIFPAYIQPKLDGMRNKTSIKGMYSRNGKIITSSPHVYNELKTILESNDIIFDGELYNHDLKHDFNKIISLCKKTKPTQESIKESKELIQYYIYDIISNDKFSDRYKILQTLFKKHLKNNKYIKLLKTYEVNSYEEIEKYYEEFLDDGYEGAIIRLNTPYENKRTKSLLKLKSSMDDEFEIVDVIEGEGNRSGMAGNVVCKLHDNINTFNPSVKGDRDYCRNLLINKKKYIGKKATIEFQNYTPAGIPRHPRMKVIRDYE